MNLDSRTHSPTFWRALRAVLLVFTVTGVSAAPGDAPTGVATALATAIEELLAANTAWKENEKELKDLQRNGGATDAEIRDFAAFVDGLRKQVLDGCREVQALGGNPQQQVAECRRIDDASRKTADKRDDRSRPPRDGRQGSPGRETGEAAARPADGQRQATAAGPGAAQAATDPADGRRAGRGAADNGDRQAARAGAVPQRPGASGSAARQTTRAAVPGGAGDQRGGQHSQRRSAQAGQDTTSQGYRSRLDALEAELDGYLNTELGRLRDKARSTRQAKARAGAAEAAARGSGADGAWGGGGDIAASATPPVEPGAGPGVRKDDTAARRESRPGATGGCDDDVVARQLREAAEAETDPETRRRLWEEYEKYKDSTC